MKNDALEIYLHIPFCAAKCRYCDFLSAPADRSTQDAYVKALLREIGEKACSFSDRRVTTIFFGGGTPSVLAAGAVAELMEMLGRSFAIADDAEITLECNPGTLSREKLTIFRGCGINRLSIGVQSANNRELAMLGRIHTYEDFLINYEQARKTGFQNINLDLICGLPGQRIKDFEKSLKTVLRLRPEHVSVYSLMIEEDTDFYRLYGDDERTRQSGGKPLLLPDEETERMMYHRTREMLTENGYLQYEISNFAKMGYSCRHNRGYWHRTEYLGLGLGASSLLCDVRSHVTRELSEYLAYDFAPREETKIDRQGRMEEFMFLGLRETEGVEKAEFYRQFGVTMRNVYGEALDKMAENGLLTETDRTVALTEAGVDVANFVMAQFLLDRQS